MSKLKTNTIQHTGGSADNITLDNSQNVTVEGNLTVDGTTTISGYNPTSSRNNRNLIINGAMQVNQRGSTYGLSDFNPVSSALYTLDRWLLGNGSSFDTDSMRIKQVSDSPDEFSNSLRVDIGNTETPSAGQNAAITQRIEAQNLQHLAYGTSSAKSCTLSFWVRSNKTGTYCLQVAQNDAGKYVLYEYTISSSNTWEKKTITFSGNTSDAITNDNGRGLDINWHLTCGSDDHVSATTSWTAKPGGGTGSAFLATSNQVNLWDHVDNVWYITGVQLEVGSVATDFEYRSYADEFQKCLRYYFEVGNNTGTWMYLNPLGHDNNTIEVIPVFPVPMRAGPTVTATGTINCRACANGNSGATVTLGGSSFNAPGNTVTTGHTWWDATSGTPFSGGYFGRIYGGTSTSSINFDAEL